MREKPKWLSTVSLTFLLLPGELVILGPLRFGLKAGVAFAQGAEVGACGLGDFGRGTPLLLGDRNGDRVVEPLRSEGFHAPPAFEPPHLPQVERVVADLHRRTGGCNATVGVALELHRPVLAHLAVIALEKQCFEPRQILHAAMVAREP
jgi:hypothetical protein